MWAFVFPVFLCILAGGRGTPGRKSYGAKPDVSPYPRRQRGIRLHAAGEMSAAAGSGRSPPRWGSWQSPASLTKQLSDAVKKISDFYMEGDTALCYNNQGFMLIWSAAHFPHPSAFRPHAQARQNARCLRGRGTLPFTDGVHAIGQP